MLLTASSGRAAPLPTLTALFLLAAIALRVLKLLPLVHRRRLDLWPDDLLHGLDPVRHEVPLLAVPLLDHHGTAALVVVTAHLDRVREAFHPELLQPLVREIQIFE